MLPSNMLPRYIIMNNGEVIDTEEWDTVEFVEDTITLSRENEERTINEKDIDRWTCDLK